MMDTCMRVVAWIALLWCIAVSPPVGAAVAASGDSWRVPVPGNIGPHVLETADGRVLVVGLATSLSTVVDVSRFQPNGVPDTSFGDQGRAVVDLHLKVIQVTAAALQPDGKIVLAGVYDSNYGALPFVARLRADGVVDAAFGKDGVSEPGTGATEPIYTALLVLANGDILAAISDWTDDRIDHYAADGRPLGNLIRLAFAPMRMALQSDGYLVVSGYHRDLKKSGVMRLDASGNVDATFGESGFASLDWYPNALQVEPGTDRIVACGPAIARLTADGHPDTTFGTQGTGYVALGADSVPPYSYCHRLVTMWDGSTVFVAARTGETIEDDLVFVTGLTSQGLADPRFASDGGPPEVLLGSSYARGSYWDRALDATRTHDGDALIAFHIEEGLQLVRVDLNAGEGKVTLPPYTGNPGGGGGGSGGSGNDGGAEGGGGGALAWPELALLAVLTSMIRRPRRHAEVSMTRH